MFHFLGLALGLSSYRSFAELVAHERENWDWRRIVRPRDSEIAIVVPHGGNIEAGTAEIGRAAAGDELSLYCFEGIKSRHNGRLHITSTRFDDPACLQLVARAKVAVTVHGCADRRPFVAMGGLHRELRQEIARGLSAAGFAVVETDPQHRGENPRNICNRGREGRGVQLEISHGLRRTMFVGLAHLQRGRTTPVFEEFVAAVRRVLTGPAGPA